MPFTLLQVNSHLKSINPTGGLSPYLNTPSGITYRTTKVPRFAKFNGYVIVVNTPTRPVAVNEDGLVFPLTPIKPQSAVALSATGSGSLTGNYRALQTFIIKDALGNVITESDYGPVMSAAVATATQKLAATYAASIETGVVTLGSRLYRTAAGGTDYFKWVDDMTNGTTVTDGSTDAAIDIVAAPDRGSAPDLTLIASWNGRLWGVDRADVDHLRYTEAGTMYGWSSLNSVPIHPLGGDAAGITALIPRRSKLGVARLDNFAAVAGTVRANIASVGVPGGEKCGVVSQESVVVHNDIAYFLWRDGVYKWDDAGISCLSNGKVRAWFVSDTYFNKTMFWRAFAQLDPNGLKYRLFLASAGSTTIDRWIEYDILTDSWWGPHRTDAFNPTCAVLVAGTNQKPFYMVGSQEGHLSQESETKTDWGVAAIAMLAKTREDVGGRPDMETYYGDLSVFTEKQTGTLRVIPYLGDVGDTDATASMDADTSEGRVRLGRIGTGGSMQLLFSNAAIGEDIVLYGYTVDPVYSVGKR
jgi:hypothetical protein